MTSQYVSNVMYVFLQTATKMLGLYAKLRELGHPNFLTSPMSTNLRFTLTFEEADQLVGYCICCDYISNYLMFQVIRILLYTKLMYNYFRADYFTV